jgi:hypothetical protein
MEHNGFRTGEGLIILSGIGEQNLETQAEEKVMNKKKSNVPVEAKSTRRQFSPAIAGDVLATARRI